MKNRFLTIGAWVIGCLVSSFALLIIFEDSSIRSKLQAVFFLAVGLFVIPVTRKLIQKLKWYLVGVLLILLMFNPSPSEFENYARDGFVKGEQSFRRESNYFVCSIYEYQNRKGYQQYLGFLGNFFAVDY